MRFAREGKLRNIVIAKHRQHLGIQAVEVQGLEIDIMIGAVAVFERQIRSVAPAIRFARQERDALGGGRRADKCWKVRRQ